MEVLIIITSTYLALDKEKNVLNMLNKIKFNENRDLGRRIREAGNVFLLENSGRSS